MCNSHQLATLAPGGDVFLCGLGSDGKGGGGLEEGLGVKLLREIGPELLFAEGASIGRGLDGSGDVGKGVVHADDVLQEDSGDMKGVFVVIGPAGEGFFEDAVFHHTEGGEDHGDAEGYKAQTADGGDDIDIAAEDCIVLEFLKDGVELVLLLFGEGEDDVRSVLKLGVEVEEFRAKAGKVFVDAAVSALGKDVVPGDAGGKAVEDKSAEKAVLGVRDEILNLAGRAGEDGREAGAFDVDVFPVFAAGVGYGLVLERLAEALGVVAVVGGEGVGKGVAFGFKHQAFLVVLAEGLVEGRGTGVCGDEEDAEGRSLGLVQVLLVLGGIVGSELLFIFSILGLVLLPEGFVDGLRNGAAEGESALACRCVTGYEEEEVGVEDEFVIFSADAGKAGRYDSQGAKEEQVGIFGRFLAGDDFLEEVGQRIRQGVRDGRSLRFLCSLHSLCGWCGGNGMCDSL